MGSARLVLFDLIRITYKEKSECYDVSFFLITPVTYFVSAL